MLQVPQAGVMLELKMQASAAKRLANGLENHLRLASNDKARLRTEHPHQIAAQRVEFAFAATGFGDDGMAAAATSGTQQVFGEEHGQSTAQGAAGNSQLAAQFSFRRHQLLPPLAAQTLAKAIRGLIGEGQTDGQSKAGR